MKKAEHREKGSTLVEFTLVGIPLMFVLISIFEVSRLTWMYETVAHAVREGARYAAVHGQDCAVPPNSCNATVAMIAQRIQDGGAGLPPNDLNITISVVAASSSNVIVSLGPMRLIDALANTQDFSAWTYASSGTTLNASAPGNDVVVSGVVPFNSALSMFWPGAGRVSFNVVNLAATSRERIGF